MTTPSHPEYPAGHPSLNGAAATVLLRHFNDRQTFTLTTAGQPSRTYASISQARADGNNARVWGGMHYPSTVAISDATGAAIAEYVGSERDAAARGAVSQAAWQVPGGARPSSRHEDGLAALPTGGSPRSSNTRRCRCRSSS